MIPQLGTLDYILLPIFGAVIGMIGTFLGIGGGFATVPLLNLVYGFPVPQTTGTSLAIIFCNAASGTVSYVRQKRVNFEVGIPLALATVPGAIVGEQVAHYLSRVVFQITFGAFMLFVTTAMWYRKGREERAPQAFSRKRLGWMILISVGIGFVSSVLGIGGGNLHVPAMLFILAMPIHAVTATSHFILAISVLVGVTAYALDGAVNFSYALLIGGGAIVGAQLGGALSRHVKGNFLRQTFAVLLFLSALWMLYEGIFGRR